MKQLVLLLTFTLMTPLYAKSALSLSYKQYKKKNFFTALDIIATRYKYETPNKKIKRYIEKLVTQTGTHYFNTYSDLELRKLNIPTTDLIMGKRNLYLKKFKYAHKRLKRIPKSHRLYPESLLVKGTAYLMEGKYQKALKTYKNCSNAAFAIEKKTKNKSKNYFAVLKETCIINTARIHFKEKDYKRAIANYESIPKRSFKWPHTLLEKAWSYYYTGNYNRSLGILLTYNSPLLESYFTPEAEVLKALNYFKLCLYEDALETVEKYYSVYAPRSKKLKSIITIQGSKPLFFHDLMFRPIAESEQESKFLRNLITQMSKRIKFNLDLNYLYRLNEEIVKVTNPKSNKLLVNMQTDLKEQINHYVKVSMYKFINEIHKLSSEMFNLKLEILSKKRELAYKNRTFKNDRSRGDFKNIKREKDQEFYTFKNAFWADELGDYSLALTSTCKTRKLK